MVSAVFVRFCPSPAKVSVVLLGGGAPIYFDFARLSFHVPISGFLCASPTRGIAVATRAGTTNAIVKMSATRRFWKCLAPGGWNGHTPPNGIVRPAGLPEQENWPRHPRNGIIQMNESP